jgi:hypothetical protein
MTLAGYKTAHGMASKILSIWFPIKKKEQGNHAELMNYVGYVTIPGLNNGQKIYINRGLLATDVDVW